MIFWHLKSLTSLIILSPLGLRKLEAVLESGGFASIVFDENEDKKKVEVCEGVFIQKGEIDCLKGLERIKELAERDPMCAGLKKLRDTKDVVTFKAFVHYALRNMIPSNEWVASKSEICVGKICTIYDEAFAVLVLMNNWLEWKAMVGGQDRRRDENSRTLFTNKHVSLGGERNSGSTEGSRRRKKKNMVQIKGWSEEGISVYNKILQYLVSVRNESEYKDIEEELLEIYKDEEGDGTKGGKRKRSDVADEILLKKTKPFDAYSLTFVQM